MLYWFKGIRFVLLRPEKGVKENFVYENKKNNKTYSKRTVNHGYTVNDDCDDAHETAARFCR